MSDEDGTSKILADRYEIDVSQVQGMKEAFGTFIEDKSGTVHSNKIATLLRAQGLHPNETELLKIKADLACDETGHITFEEYVKQASKLDSDPVEAEDRLRASFRLFDPLGTGVINAEILRGILTQTGDVFTQDEVDEMLADANVDTSGVINYEEFIRLMMTK